MIKLPERMAGVPPYLYAEMDKVIQEARNSGKEIINIAHGDPDLMPPQEVIEELSHRAGKPGAQLYPPYWGLIELREDIARWMGKRFGVELSPEDEIMILIGAKEGLTHLYTALCDRGDYALIPDPAYPTYKTSVIFAEGMVHYFGLKQENDFLPELKEITKNLHKKTKLMIINYPNNPTTKKGDITFFKELVSFCRRHNIYLIHDNPYSEIYETDPPPSILQVDGAKDIAVELHSFSKTFNMQGYRIGWICGNKDMIKALAVVKTNTDSGIFLPIQYAAIKALELYETFVPGLREIYKKRRKIVQGYLEKIGWQYYRSDSTIYVWTRMDERFKDSMKFVIGLIKEKGVMIGPGAGYGRYGEGYLRFSLTQPEEKLRTGMERFLEFVNP
ncbi:hypothetical protein BXT86_01030 [candidate division WOR-3 bacterium 4484_100]|uniref:Aminotransferase n=1 Tax=candidate division WOR-3 bacterium 4484_100 TaxID=1936077 RepID=A0A1V4QGW9_UNCW3|nr:MAG: hypothetical protein BXT86_01030 [candidate division WOR-3 bacterium 4484_100]